MIFLASRETARGKYFLDEKKYDIAKIVLLSPFDMKAELEYWPDMSFTQTVAMVKEHVQQGFGNELLDHEPSHTTMSHNTFLSWYGNADVQRVFELTDPTFVSPVLSQITIPVFIALGDKDEYFYKPSQGVYREKLDELTIRFPNAKNLLISDAHHSYESKEDELVAAVISFVLS